MNQKKRDKSVLPKNRKENGHFVQGHDLAGPGRPRGSKNFKTLYFKTIKRLAEKEDKDPEQYEEDIIAAAVIRAIKGDFRFYKDLMDRVYGKAREQVEDTSDEEAKTLFDAFNSILSSKKAPDSTIPERPPE